MAKMATAQSPLKGQFQFKSNSQLSVQEMPGITQFQAIIRKGKTIGRGHKLSPLEGAEIDGLFICAVGPGDYWIFTEKHDEQGINKLLGETASLFEQSHGRVVLRIEGACAADILAKGSPLDAEVMPERGAAHTVVEHIPVLVAKHDEVDGYLVSIPRSFANSFVAWLTEAALDFAEK